MRYNLYFDMSAIAVTGVILVSALISKWIPTYKNTAYHKLTLGVFLTALSDFLTCMLEMNPVKENWYIPVKYALDSGYHFFHVLTGMFFLQFGLSLINIQIYSRKRRILVYMPFVINTALLLINLFYPMVFGYGGDGSYSRGPAITLIYVIGLYYLIGVVGMLWRYRKSVTHRIRNMMAVYAALSISGIAIQTVRPDFMVGEFMNSIALVLMYLNIETADEIKDDRYGILTRNAYLQSAKLNIINETPFHTIFVRISDAHVITSGKNRVDTDRMNLVVDFLKRYKKEVWIGVWDENCLVLDMIQPNEVRANEIMAGIDTRFHEPWETEEGPQMFDDSIWLVRYPEDIQSVQDLSLKADLMMGSSLQRHRGIVHFSGIDFTGVSWKQRMNEHAREALRKRTIEVRYGPVYDLRSEKVVSARAVLFFPDEEGRMVDGNAFIDTAGGEEFLSQLDEYALQDAAKNQQYLMRNSTLEEVSTRLAYSEITSRKFEDRMNRICDRNRSDCTKMMSRIADGTYARLQEDHVMRLRNMMDQGWILAIDDFGIGQSFLSRLADSRITYVIMNPSVCASMLGSEEGRALGKGIIYAIHGIGKTVTMTGIHTEEDAQTAKELGADYVSGDFLCEPMSPEKFRVWMKERGYCE